MDIADAALALVVIGIPVVAFAFLIARWMKMKERKLELEASLAAEKAAQYAASNAELEARVRILEQIVTDRGAETASQIEALGEHKRIESGEKTQ